MLRMATAADKAELKALWLLCFPEETQEFLDWFFDNRFLPEYCPVLVEAGRVAACLHALPTHIRLRGSALPCAIVAGVATHPDFRGRGLMRQVLGFFLERMRAEGVPLLPHRPVRLEVYRSAGHFPVSDSGYLQLPAGAPRPARDACVELCLPAHYAALYRCYARFSQGYSGIIDRSYPDFVFKCQDYLSCGAKAIAALDGEGGVAGYCVYYDEPSGLVGEECVALSRGAYGRLWEGLARRSAGRPLTLRLAPDAGLRPAGAQARAEPRGVLGVADVTALFRVTGLSGGAIQVEDPLVAANRGVFDLTGRPSSEPPQLRIPAGRLAQWAVGYRTLESIVQAGEAEAADPAIVAKMDSIGTCPCFIIDEY